ncbi:MAG: DNA-binding protein [Candidatus Roizmanbacteria bacterium GW2011_GWA2_37_7]|uniref:DNA-binding protein n=1 Tax=Candidatus Roizmanbacteria bacterium GW2011_GWA2_37_7 TaxID=1618481 RepID=A0A0G0KAP3_9BACT|nr:MAG: DNA-binding protein [Candidatus Roizmanbacteria bacterium GW2011_GWA2_37_7]
MVMNVLVNSTSQQKFGRNLREIRMRKKLSQEDVANATGISVTYYAGIERGEENPTFAVLENICRALKVKSSQILPF